MEKNIILFSVNIVAESLLTTIIIQVCMSTLGASRFSKVWTNSPPLRRMKKHKLFPNPITFAVARCSKVDEDLDSV